MVLILLQIAFDPIVCVFVCVCVCTYMYYGLPNINRTSVTKSKIENPVPEPCVVECKGSYTINACNRYAICTIQGLQMERQVTDIIMVSSPVFVVASTAGSGPAGSQVAAQQWAVSAPACSVLELEGSEARVWAPFSKAASRAYCPHYLSLSGA